MFFSFLLVTSLLKYPLYGSPNVPSLVATLRPLYFSSLVHVRIQITASSPAANSQPLALVVLLCRAKFTPSNCRANGRESAISARSRRAPFSGMQTTPPLRDLVRCAAIVRPGPANRQTSLRIFVGCGLISFSSSSSRNDDGSRAAPAIRKAFTVDSTSPI